MTFKIYEFLKRYKDQVAFLGKFLISATVLYWLYVNGEISYKNVELAATNKKLILSFIILTFMQLLLGAVRMHSLMQFKKTKSKVYGKLVLISWASSFIHCIAPSALFGEAYRVKELMSLGSDHKKDVSVYTAIYSKIFSFVSLIIISICAALMLQYSFNSTIDLSKSLLFISIFSLLVLFIVMSSLLYIFREKFSSYICKNDQGYISRRISALLQFNLDVVGNARHAMFILAVSFSIQLLNIISIILIIFAINHAIYVSVLELIYLVPIGIIAMLLPVSISGLGVGNLAFSELLGRYGLMNGSDVFMVFFAFSYVFNLAGLFPMLILVMKKK